MCECYLNPTICKVADSLHICSCVKSVLTCKMRNIEANHACQCSIDPQSCKATLYQNKDLHLCQCENNFPECRATHLELIEFERLRELILSLMPINFVARNFFLEDSDSEENKLKDPNFRYEEFCKGVDAMVKFLSNKKNYAFGVKFETQTNNVTPLLNEIAMRTILRTDEVTKYVKYAIEKLDEYLGFCINFSVSQNKQQFWKPFMRDKYLIDYFANFKSLIPQTIEIKRVKSELTNDYYDQMDIVDREKYLMTAKEIAFRVMKYMNYTNNLQR